LRTRHGWLTKFSARASRLIERVVVTGGAGYVGSVVAGHLLLAGYSVVVLDSCAAGAEALLGYVDHPRFDLVAGDVRDRALLRKAFQSAHAVVHLAAVVGEPACAVDPDASRAINTGATL